MSVSREKLHDEVWAEPMTTVALRYGVSSNFLARVCQRLNVPTPQRGYWQQQWIREEQERRRAQNLKASREELFAIIEAWAVAKRIEEFFQDVEGRAPGIDDVDSKALLDRLRRARQMLGGTDALSRFRTWKAPEER
jgi:hypothetical protein